MLVAILPDLNLLPPDLRALILGAAQSTGHHPRATAVAGVKRHL